MATNNPVKRYDRDLGRVVPMVRFGPSEFPRLNSWPAPYLPLQLENDRHDEFYVILTGKVLALDSMGFLVPAGLRLQLDTMEAEILAAAGGNLDASAANANLDSLWRYDADDVANGVVNVRGQTVKLGEPVVFSFFEFERVGGAGAITTQYNAAAANTSTAIPVDATPLLARDFDVGNHIGIAPYSMLRAASDVMSRAQNENEMHPDAATGPEAAMPYDPTQLRNLAWELQNRATVLVRDEVLVYPVVADRTGVLLEGQAVAIGAMADFDLGAYVTYDAESDIVPATLPSNTVAEAAAVAEIAALDAVIDAVGTPDATQGDEAAAAVVDLVEALFEGLRGTRNEHIVGQIVRKNTRFPSSLLNRVATRWADSIPGFEAIDRMPGSATDGYPWHMHTAGSTLGEVQISLGMR